MRLLLTLAALGTFAASPAHAEATDAVRGYFSALARQDFGGALSLTDGAAQSRTSHMVSRLQNEAAAHHARVEVKVTKLDVRAPGAPEPGLGVPVPVVFHIDVVGHKWLFHRVARTLDGCARFWVNADRIVAIDGSID